ncbi:DUF6760 family protein [Herbivorax sp. ANBcel31]|uniref:DUF6760 family protein n=1 Tax=Herbivorax sp. ANBcel31 TaxID=3069754 RepID=UPI0027D230D8|nr:DUF6760 family protein [Herbivorax sp. ANBcel31]
MSVYPAEKLYKEVAFIAYYFHWNHDDIMAMDHRERKRWCEEISRINSQLNDSPKNIFEGF